MLKLFSVNPYSRLFSLRQQIALAKEAGFDGLDYVIPLQDLFRNKNMIAKAVDDYAIPVLGLHCPLPFIVYLPSLFFNKTLQYFSNFTDCKIYNFHLSGFIPLGENHNRLLLKFIALAKEKNIPISFESNATHYSTAKLFPKVSYQPEPFGDYCLKHNLPITLDVSHIAYLDYSILDFYKNYHNHISLIHISDYADKREHLFPGEGKLPLKELCEELKKTHYKGNLSFEIDLDKKDSVDQIKRLRKSLTFINNYIQ